MGALCPCFGPAKTGGEQRSTRVAMRREKKRHQSEGVRLEATVVRQKRRWSYERSGR